MTNGIITVQGPRILQELIKRCSRKNKNYVVNGLSENALTVSV